jgi:hypothetical protein
MCLWVRYKKKYDFFISLKSLKKETGLELDSDSDPDPDPDPDPSGSAPKCHRSPTLVILYPSPTETVQK